MTAAEPAGRASRRATLLALLAAVTVLAAAGAVWAVMRADAVVEGNAAFADPQATREVTEEIGGAVKAVFSYDHADLARTERAADRVLVGEAVRQYRASFAAAKERASTHRLVRSTTVRSTGVRELRGGHARLLVVVDQRTLTADMRPRRSTTACLDIVAERVDGSWRIAKISVL
ncbi:hypothetical protein ACFS2C_18960 [Prauserella oleivorans]|uniref:Mce-associated membrane protein n=1 Tax=Prauserella oleivorans TaxID=1478153 RepID=A0ABW5WBU9_9PSEU